MTNNCKISIDTAVEGIALLLGEKMKQANVIKNTTQKDIIAREIAMLQKERGILYGKGSEEDFNRVMNKVEKTYSPIIKNAVITRTSIGNLL
jgi:hypothetical protein